MLYENVMKFIPTSMHCLQSLLKVLNRSTDFLYPLGRSTSWSSVGLIVAFLVALAGGFNYRGLLLPFLRLILVVSALGY